MAARAVWFGDAVIANPAIHVPSQRPAGGYGSAMGGNGVGALSEGMRGFPAALTSFVGRADEVGKVAELLQEYRLVTVTGPGGVGKTRLAGAVARQVVGRFADGVQLVELAAVADPALVFTATAAAVGAQLGMGAPVLESLVAVLARQQVLLVLDNCEHVLDAVAELCSELLAVADDLRVLATSREPISLAGEARFRLRPLPVPGPGAPGGPATAVALFADRARSADPEFRLDAESEPAVTRLVSRLDGMPLAIELAAARVDALGLGQLLDRLEDTFRLLTSTDRRVSARHRSLAATVEWSYRLLGEEEQRVFRRLSVFPGPFTLEAAVAVAGTDTESAVLHLVDCSLLTPPRRETDDRLRYLMLETIRAFGTAQLAGTTDGADADAALARYALSAAEQANQGRRSREEAAAARLLDAEDATIQQAVTWTLEHDLDMALRLALAVADYWEVRGRAEMVREILLAAASHAAPGSLQWCLAQFWLGDIGPPDLSIGHESAAIEVLSAQSLTPLLAELLAARARTHMHFGRMPEAVSDALRALEVACEVSYAPGEILALAVLSRAAHYAGDAGAALDWARQAQQVLASGDFGWTLRFTGPFIVEILLESGDLTAARGSLNERLAGARDTGDLIAQAYYTGLTADLDLRTGDLAGAGGHLREAIEIRVRVDPRSRPLSSLDLLGHLCVARNQWTEAVTIWSAFQAGLDAENTLDLPLRIQRRQEPLGQAVRALGPDRTRAAQERGAMMSTQTVTEFALLLAGAPTQTTVAQPEPPGVAQLSAREQELVSLVATGRTDAQIAGQLYISISTVRSHLDRIRDKTSCRRRADLTRLALQAGLA
jgi:predicted ATPase/DNA-binding CsgD family transcriptional regulator